VPFFGCGRGAFESSFPPFRVDAGYVTFAYPEDVVAQWSLEWGLPIAIVGFAVVLIALRPSAVLARSTTAAGAWAGLVALGVQNLGDLGTEIPGLMLAAAVCAAIVVAGAPGKGARWRFELWGRVPRRVAIVGWVAASSAIGLAARGIGRELYDDQRAVRDAAVDRSVSSSAFDKVVRDAMLRHPGEPYLPFVAAQRASNTRDYNLMAWIGATLERAAVYGPAHLLLARALVLRSPAQARLEYRTAMEQAPLLEGAILAEVLPLTNSFSDAMELVPVGSDGLAVLENLSLRVANKLPATRVLLDEQVAARAPMKPGPSLSAATDAVEDLVEGGRGASWCEGIQRATCLRDALTKAKRAEGVDPSECAAYSLHARALMASGDVSGGLQELEAATAAVIDRVSCLKELSALAREAGDDERAEAALAKVASIGCVGNVECARELAWVAQQEDEHGNPGKAFAFYKQAHERAPEDDALLESVAVRAVRAGLHAEAAVDYEELARRHPTKEGWRNAAQSEREAAVTGLLRQ
jgi:tetratricopeptide (TPR) repeat protein